MGKKLIFALGISGWGLFLGWAAPAAAASPPPAVHAQAAILEDLSTGQVLYAKNQNVPLGPASTTKIMTALLALKYDGANLDRVITVPPSASGIIGSSVYLAPHQQLTLRALLYGMILRSGNDAAVAVADAVAGSVPQFVAMMNAEARQLGATHTHFANPDGLWSNDHYTTARDMALIARAAMSYPMFRKLVDTRKYLFPGYPKPFEIYNQDKMLWQFPGTIGIKPGYTIKSGETLVSAVQRNGVTLLSVVLNTDARDLWLDPEKMFTWGFSNFTPRTYVEKGQNVGYVVRSGRHIPLVAAAGLTRLAPVSSPGAGAWQVVDSPGKTLAKGQVVGSLVVRQGGQVIGSVPIASGAQTPPLKAKQGANVPEILGAIVVLMLMLRLVNRTRRRLRRKVRYRFDPRLLK